MDTRSHKARQRSTARLRAALSEKSSVVVARLFRMRMRESGRRTTPSTHPPKLESWEEYLQALHTTAVQDFGNASARDWLRLIVHGAWEIDGEFFGDLMGAAKMLGVEVPLAIHSVRTLGPGRRAEIVSQSTRIALSRA